MLEELCIGIFTKGDMKTSSFPFISSTTPLLNVSPFVKYLALLYDKSYNMEMIDVSLSCNDTKEVVKEVDHAPLNIRR